MNILLQMCGYFTDVLEVSGRKAKSSGNIYKILYFYFSKISMLL